MLDQVNKINAFAGQLVCLVVPVTDENIVMTLLESLLTSFKYLITFMETMPMKEFMIDYMAVRFMHGMLKRKEKKSQSEYDVMML